MVRTYLYQPKTDEDYKETVYHLNQAGIIVLLVLDESVPIDDGLEKDGWYYNDWKERNEIADIVQYIKEISSFTTYISYDRDYI